MKGIIFAAAVVLFLAGGAEAGIREGQWSMTTTIRMEGMDDETTAAMQEMENMSPEDKAMMEGMMGGMGMQMGRAGGGMGMTTKQCLTNDNPVPDPDQEDNCTETHSQNGNTVSFEVTCAKSHSTGQVTYRNDSMNGTITSTDTKTKETVTIDVSGEYLGPCPPASTTLNRNNTSVQALADKEIAIKEKELALKDRELALKAKELELKAGANSGNTQAKGKSAVENVSDAARTTSNVTGAFNGLRSLLGR